MTRSKGVRVALAGVLVLVAACALAVLAPSACASAAAAEPAPAPPLAKPAVPASGAYLGASASVHNGESRADAIARTEAELGRPLAIDHQYYRWDQPLVGAVQEADAAAGRIPFVSWKPQTAAGVVIPWTAIAAGEQDDFIRATAATMRDFGHPMFAVFHHEPYDESISGQWGTAADFVAAYRRVVQLFREEGAGNVAWVLVLTSWDYTQGRGDAFYPGADVVDWVAADPYNWHQRDGRWVPLSEVAADFYEWGVSTGLPLMLAEWGSTEDPATDGRKAAWFDDALATLRGWPEIRAAVYFNNLHDGYDWRIDTSPSALEAFRRLAGDDHFQPEAGPPPPAPPPPPSGGLDCEGALGVFDDVLPGNVHALAIACAVLYGLLDDPLGDRFDPDRPVTRGELAGFVSRALDDAGVDATASDVKYDDVAGDPHEDEIRHLGDLGVLLGYPDGSFRPGAEVTREQLASILVRAHDVAAPAPLPAPAAPLFDDTAGSVHAADVDRAGAAGLVQGLGPRWFLPAGNASRAQVAAVVTRLLERFVAEGVPVAGPA